MADNGFRDLIGSFSPSRRTEPTVAPPATAAPIRSDAAPSPAIVTPPPSAPPSLFGPDRASTDGLGLEPTYGRLAELVLHRRTGTPLAIGILGAPGSGKSFALGRIAARTRALASRAADVSDGPFVPRVHVAIIDAAALDGEPMLALAGRVHAALGETDPDLARAVAHGAGDPHAALRECNDKLDEARRRLDGERRALDDVGSRRARLIETVLYETSGSAVDAFARANRAALARRFVGFGMGGDAIRNYKDFVLNAAAPGRRAGLALRALWAFKGQTRLILAAILFVALGLGLGIATATQDTWLADMRGGRAGAATATWLEAHIGLMATIRSAAFALAALCVAANLYRAVAFLRPIWRGTTLLAADLDGRRRDLDGLYAHQTKRVDILEADVERLTRDAGAAERRADGRAEPSPFEPAGAGVASALFAAMASGTRRDLGGGTAGASRILLVVDNLDAVAVERAEAILSALKRGLGDGMVALVALDPTGNGADARRKLENWIDIPVSLPPPDGPGSLMARMLGRTEARAAVPASDPTTSSLDAAIDDREGDLLAAVAPLAGTTPRALRRFIDLYRLARLDGDAPRGALAMALALTLGGTREERTATAEAMRTLPDVALPTGCSQRLRAAWEAAAHHDGGGPDEAAMERAAGAALLYGFAPERADALTERS